MRSAELHYFEKCRSEWKQIVNDEEVTAEENKILELIAGEIQKNPVPEVLSDVCDLTEDDDDEVTETEIEQIEATTTVKIEPMEVDINNNEQPKKKKKVSFAVPETEVFVMQAMEDFSESEDEELSNQTTEKPLKEIQENGKSSPISKSPQKKFQPRRKLVPKENYKCPTCERILATKSSFREHVEALHLKITNFTCDACSKSYYHRKSFNHHLKICPKLAANDRLRK